MPYPLTFVHIPGDQNVVADALSRYPPPRLYAISVFTPAQWGLLHKIKAAGEKDPWYQRCLQNVGTETQRPLRHPNDYQVTWENLLLYRGTIVVPRDDVLRTSIIAEAHDPIVSGHFGMAKTYEKVKRSFYWPLMGRDIQEYVKTCPLCQQMKHVTSRAMGLYQPILSPYPWHTITMDFVGKFAPSERSGNTHCLVIVDKFSKYTLLRAVPETCDARLLAEIFLEMVVSTFGVPVKVISDRGPQFTARLWHETLTQMGVTIGYATSHNPKTDGQTERMI